MKTENENGVKYIQLDIGFFDNKKIKAIRGLPSGSDILVIWIELLVLAGQINDCGSIYFNHEVPYTADMLAAQFGFPPATIQLALTTFVKFEMVEIIDDVIMISNWRKYQNENALERIKMLHNARQRAYYQRKKSQRITDGSVSADVSNSVISDENCSYISNISNTSSLSKDNEDKNTGCGEKEKKEKRLEEMFSAFYEAYGNKKSRKIAEKAFKKICPDEELFQRIMDGVEKYHKSRKWLEGYRKEPATWLNGECWNDEYDDERSATDGGKETKESKGTYDRRNYRGCDEEMGPRTKYNLKPRFAGHKYDEEGNDITARA